MVAKTYDEKRDFDMQVEWSSVSKRLSEVGYDGVPASVILFLLALVLTPTGDCKRKAILNLDKDEIIDVWDQIVDALEQTVDYFRTVYRIPVSSLLPYDALLVPFAYWFYCNKSGDSDGAIGARMREFFWRASLSNRYSSGVETKLASDKRRVDDIMEGKSAPWSDLGDRDLIIDGPQALIETNFATGNSLCKAILCLFAHEQPRNFDNDGVVLLDNSHLKIASSKNYHHFFPKKHLRDAGKENENSVVNITLIGADLNKRKIRAKSPQIYIASCEKDNKTIQRTLETHLIERDGMGIDEDDYDLFLNRRAEKIWKLLELRIRAV